GRQSAGPMTGPTVPSAWSRARLPAHRCWLASQLFWVAVVACPSTMGPCPSHPASTMLVMPPGPFGYWLVPDSHFLTVEVDPPAAAVSSSRRQGPLKVPNGWLGSAL